MQFAPHNVTAGTYWFSVWEGYADLHDRKMRARVRHPRRRYLLYSGSIEAAVVSPCGAARDGFWSPSGGRAARRFSLTKRLWAEAERGDAS